MIVRMGEKKRIGFFWNWNESNQVEGLLDWRSRERERNIIVYVHLQVITGTWQWRMMMCVGKKKQHKQNKKKKRVPAASLLMGCNSRKFIGIFIFLNIFTLYLWWWWSRPSMCRIELRPGFSYITFLLTFLLFNSQVKLQQQSVVYNLFFYFLLAIRSFSSISQGMN